MAGAPAVAYAPVATGVKVGRCRVLAGTSSWADRSLVSEGSFYPSRSLKAAERLAYYAHRLPLAEVATTYRFPPTPELSRRWAGTSPEGFTIDIRAWSLLSGAPTWPESLWPDLQPFVRRSRRESNKLYRSHLPEAVLDECWERFVHALRPLQQAGRLGTVVLRFPSWFTPRETAWQELAALPSRLGGFEVAVELCNDRWFERDACEQTLAFLEHLDLGFVVQVGPHGPQPVVAATSGIGLVRFNSKNAGSWEGTPYRYSREELAAWVPAVRELASGTRQVHIIMDNCWRSDAVDNAGDLLDLLSQS